MFQKVNNLRYKFYLRALKKKLAELKRAESPRKAINFDRAKTIGILFDASSSANCVFMNEYRETLIERGKEVSILGYFDDKQTHSNVIFKYFNKKDLSWYWHPKSQTVNEFANQPFDILISLHLHPSPPLEYVSAISKAHIRVGRAREGNKEAYDFMVDVANDYDLKGFSEQIEYYLKIINRPE